MFALKTFVLVAYISSVASSNIVISSPLITNWGDWGSMQSCRNGTYAQAFQLRTEANQYLNDDTALNSIRLFCGDPFAPNTGVITSIQGQLGDWGNIFTCHPGYLNGFQLRSESNRGTGDDTAANNIRFFCSSDPHQYIQGDGQSNGDWTESQHCGPDQAICGIQTQVQPNQGDEDDTMLNNVRMECCDM